nr:MAG TPA: hypothetical protein [Caudoviricetes sp.]
MWPQLTEFKGTEQFRLVIHVPYDWRCTGE